MNVSGDFALIFSMMNIKPMLLHTAALPFNDPDNFAELKLDGYRFIPSYTDSLHLYTKNGFDKSEKFPEPRDVPFSRGTVLDGEMIVSANNGAPDFEAMQARYHSSKHRSKVTFCAFDILMFQGTDVRELPLLQRKELLEESFDENEYYKKVRTVDGLNACGFFELVKQNNLEGIV